MSFQTELIDNLRKYGTVSELRQSAFFSECRGQIESILGIAQRIDFPGAAPVLDTFLRIVQWNIEKGKRSTGILDTLKADEILKWADVIILNEADQGMNRSQNRHVALDLARELGMNMAFGPAHLELTKGTDDELKLEGDNCEGLQGNAVLSRYPILEQRVVELPKYFEPYEFHEKRYGGRNCLWVRLQLRRRTLWVGSTHLELRNTTGSRASQLKHIMEKLPGKPEDAYVLGGDLNTNSFSRGNAWRTVQSISRLMFVSAPHMQKLLLHPECGREPLFKVSQRFGFFWEGLNSNEETARAAIDSLEESDCLPGFLNALVKKRLMPYGGYLGFKLDWLLGRGVKPLSGGQKRDTVTGATSVDPGCRKGYNAGPDRISDHMPIYADLDLT
jgi:endonuclease/exonuclease/phosphatase family metal-dependent hydrolase